MAADPDFLQDLLDFRTLVRFSERINKALEGKEPADFGVLRGLLNRKLYPVAGLTLREELLKTLADINFCKELLGDIAWALSHPLCGRPEEETLVPLAFRLQDDLKFATAHFAYLIRWKNFLPNFARSRL